jgi:type IV pilus assembly protein PilA
MNKKNISVIVVGILFGLLAAWWLGLFNQPAPPSAPLAATKPAANPFFVNQPVKINRQNSVAAPVLPPVPASQSTPPSPTVRARLPADAQSAALDQIRQQSQMKAMKNNLRQLATAASQYMLDKGVTSASYFDLVGTETDNYIRSINPAMGEDYSGIFVNQTDTEVMVVAPDGTTVTYDM